MCRGYDAETFRLCDLGGNMDTAKVRINVDGEDMLVPAGISVAAAVLGHKHERHAFHNGRDGGPRSPYCLMGVCFECMLEIDGVKNVQSCLVTVREGMTVKRQYQAGEE